MKIDAYEDKYGEIYSIVDIYQRFRYNEELGRIPHDFQWYLNNRIERGILSYVGEVDF